MVKELTKAERSLLLYLETCAVDHGGSVNTAHMNEDDIAIAKRWNESGFVEFGRITRRDITGRGTSGALRARTHWCRLSDDAWSEAHRLRRERANRSWESRRYQTTAEKRMNK